MSMMSLKGSFALILRYHPNLMEARVEIQVGKIGCTCYFIQKLIYNGHREFVLDS
jgi:hypothetical protein